MSAKTSPLRELLEGKTARFKEIEAQLLDPQTMRNSGLYASLMREQGSLRKVVAQYEAIKKLQAQLAENRALAEGDDPDMAALAREEIPEITVRLAGESERLQQLLASSSDDDSNNAIVEIRAGTGGDEASLFVADLFRMYSRYCDKRKWKMEVMSKSPSEVGGLKEVIFCVSGENAFRDLKFEGGGHRVQRVPETEAQGRVHTSACTVAVLPEQEEIDVQINPEDLRVDTMCAGGAGGQHVNKTESAVRLTHLPTGIVVVCQDERSQHKNRDRAMRILKSRLQSKFEEDARKQRGDMRKAMIGSGDRSDRIRTYNFPQNRLTDHRIGVTFYSLDRMIEGDLDGLFEKLVQADTADRLTAMGFTADWLDS